MIDAINAAAALLASGSSLGVAGLALKAVLIVVKHREKLAAQAQVKLEEAQLKALEERLAPMQADLSNLKTRLNMQTLGEGDVWK